ncbi:ABC transporter substrate-binding protein [Nocardiopsis terrae]|uniref:Tripartite ATP-independent transporter DctP family solute receptor n=1 Tax=Nocardiopsis terrae TaxID=372655 RepID=A0ABR9HKX2_9ACTN|nr:DctP family TRAP transporter solute-binding subunit [Nocardiopsis terrae]MBE1459685.1 tripartite ATP-independent transporter DctP family solute receptor [Nocardiopsis terrae]GHC94518.1 ABC transporter substrate-binding protein [Nocardiopsis terrae]
MRHPHRWTVLVPVLALGLTACGGSGDSGETGEDITLSFSNSYTPDHPHTRCGIDLVAEKMEEAEVGVNIDTFPNSQLGDNTETFASVMSGDIDMDVQGSAALGSAYEPIGVLDAAYAFDDADQMFGFFDSEDSEQLKEDFETETGAKILDAWYFGDRHFTANQAIRTPDDLDGLRMRFPDSPIYLANAEALGATPTTVAFEEVYLALQQGTADGQENPIPTISADSFDEVQSHISLSGHQVGSQMIVVSGATWQRLDEEQRSALQEAVSEVREDNRACIEEAEAEILEAWQEDGTIEVVDDVDVEAFRDQARAYFAENLDAEQLELYESLHDGS